MNRRTWKKGEARLAKLFGTHRTPLSGGNSRHSRSDSLHEKLYLERKHRKRFAVIELWRKTKALADKEGKVPVVALAELRKKGHWFLIHESHLKDVLWCLVMGSKATAWNEADNEKYYVKADEPIAPEDFHTRVRSMLSKVPIKTYGELARCSEVDLLSFKNFGETSLREVKEKLTAKGLELSHSGSPLIREYFRRGGDRWVGNHWKMCMGKADAPTVTEGGQPAGGGDALGKEM